MKKLTTVLLCVAMLLSITCHFASCANEAEDGNEDEEIFDINSVQCRVLDLTTISTEYWDNSYRAEETYIGNYVSTVGKVSTVNKGSVHIKQYNANWKSSSEKYGYAMCNMQTDDYNDLLLNLNEGDFVKVKGKVTDLEADANGVTVAIDTYSIGIMG